MFFSPSVKGHSHIAEEILQILASGFVFLYSFGTVTIVGLFLFFFFIVQPTQVSTQAGKDSCEAKSNMFLPLLSGRT